MEAPKNTGAFGRDVGLKIAAEHPDGSVEMIVDITERHTRANEIVHGGVLFTLLDSAMGAAVQRAAPPGAWVASVSITIDFLAAAKVGRVTARGWVERGGRTTMFPRAEARDADGRVVARTSGIWAVRAPRDGT